MNWSTWGIYFINTSIASTVKVTFDFASHGLSEYLNISSSVDILVVYITPVDRQDWGFY
jgi:hypothetical protein